MKLIFGAVAFIALSTASALAQSAAPANPLRRTEQPAAAATAAPQAQATSSTPGKKAAKQAASGDYKARQKRCGGEWKAAKTANSTNGQKWPQFFSACNTRLKAAGV